MPIYCAPPPASLPNGEAETRGPDAAMAQKKTSPPMTPLRPLPIRIAKLHAHLIISAAFGGIVLFALVFADWRLPTKLLAGWDAGVALYLVLMQSIIWRCDIDHLRKRASEQDEAPSPFYC
jgi:uncharacterized membrane protein